MLNTFCWKSNTFLKIILYFSRKSLIQKQFTIFPNFTVIGCEFALHNRFVYSNNYIFLKLDWYWMFPLLYQLCAWQEAAICCFHWFNVITETFPDDVLFIISTSAFPVTGVRKKLFVRISVFNEICGLVDFSDITTNVYKIVIKTFWHGYWIRYMLNCTVKYKADLFLYLVSFVYSVPSFFVIFNKKSVSL